MVWHIFKKDFRLLWPIVILVAAAQLLNSSLGIILGRFGEPSRLVQIARIFPIIAMLGLFLLIVAAIHQDTIPGIRQDWIIRPIRRWHLLLGKLLFVVLLVHGPLFVADLIEGVTDGFSFAVASRAALSHGLTIFEFFSLPAITLAAVTRNFMEMVVALIAMSLTWITFQLLVSSLLIFRPELGGSGLTWIIQTAFLGVIVLASLIVLPLQYFRRTTHKSRGLIAVAVVVALSSNLLAWKPSFAIQQRLSPQPQLHQSIAVGFEPSSGRYQSVSGQSTVPGNQAMSAGTKPIPMKGTTDIFIPLHIANLPADSSLLTDRYEVHFIAADGTTLYSGILDGCGTSMNGTESIDGPCANTRFEIRHDQSNAGAENTYHRIPIWPDLYARLKERAIRLEIDYSFTLFRLEATNMISALGGNQLFANLGWCGTRLDRNGDNVTLACLTPKTPSCVTAYLEHVPSGRKNPERHTCVPNYAPIGTTIAFKALSQFGFTAPFFDPDGLVKFPVDGPMLSESRLVIKTYQPQDHFTQHLVIPEVRLSDWEPQAQIKTERAGI